jgi:hypothetical protein
VKKGAGLFKAAMSCIAIALIAGCASNKPENGASKRSSGERQLNLVWAGKPYKDLLETYGEPSSVMEYPSSRNTVVVVYRDHAKLPANCTHAFTVNRVGVPTVVNYFCR